MSKFRLILTLMIVVALIIVGMAVYVFTNFSLIDAGRGIILIAAAIGGMIIIMGILWLIYKSKGTPL